MQTVNIAENCRGTWSPKILGEMNDRHGKAVKLKGEFVCVAGEETDERLFESKATLNRKLCG